MLIGQPEGVFLDGGEIDALTIGAMEAGPISRVGEVEPAAVGGEFLHGLHPGGPGYPQRKWTVEVDAAEGGVVQGDAEIPRWPGHGFGGSASGPAGKGHAHGNEGCRTGSLGRTGT